MKPITVKKVRRKIKKNQTYRTLKVGETVLQGDEFKDQRGDWKAAIASIGSVNDGYRPFRRLIGKRKPLSKRQVEKNREASDKSFEPIAKELDHIRTVASELSDEELTALQEKYADSDAALDIQVDTGKPFEFPPGWGLLETDDPNIKVSLEGERFKWNEAEGRYDRIEPEPIHPDWVRGASWNEEDLVEKDRKPTIVALLVISIVTNVAFLGGYLMHKNFANPQIQYRDRIEYKTEYSRPMELNGIPENPWRKAIPILPEDIKIERKQPALDQGETRKA